MIDPPVSFVRVVDALHLVENPYDTYAPGRAGELGPYQMTRAVWEQHSTLPFCVRYACDKGISEAVALKHLRWLSTELEKRRIPISTYTLALAWNAGLRGAENVMDTPLSAVRFAHRVEALASAAP